MMPKQKIATSREGCAARRMFLTVKLPEEEMGGTHTGAAIEAQDAQYHSNEQDRHLPSTYHPACNPTR